LLAVHRDQVRRLVFGPQDRFEKRLGYMVAAFETTGHRPRDDGAYVMFSDPGRMVGRVALRDDRTLFLFVFTADASTRRSRRSATAACWQCRAKARARPWRRRER
jgi:hypothetical protein